MPEKMKVEDKVALLDIDKKLKARLEIGRKSGECEICKFPIKKLPLELWSLTEFFGIVVDKRQ